MAKYSRNRFRRPPAWSAPAPNRISTGNRAALSCGPRRPAPASGGHSSAGRALALQARGHRFDPGWLHSPQTLVISRTPDHEPLRAAPPFYPSRLSGGRMHRRRRTLRHRARLRIRPLRRLLRTHLRQLGQHLEVRRDEGRSQAGCGRHLPRHRRRGRTGSVPGGVDPFALPSQPGSTVAVLRARRRRGARDQLDGRRRRGVAASGEARLRRGGSAGARGRRVLRDLPGTVFRGRDRRCARDDRVVRQPALERRQCRDVSEAPTSA